MIMMTQTVITHAHTQGVTLDKYAMAGVESAPDPLRSSLSLFVYASLGRNDLRSLGRAFNTLGRLRTRRALRAQGCGPKVNTIH